MKKKPDAASFELPKKIERKPIPAEAARTFEVQEWQPRSEVLKPPTAKAGKRDRLIVDAPEDLQKELKKEAIDRGESLSAYVVSILERRPSAGK